MIDGACLHDHTAINTLVAWKRETCHVDLENPYAFHSR